MAKSEKSLIINMCYDPRYLFCVGVVLYMCAGIGCRRWSLIGGSTDSPPLKGRHLPKMGAHSGVGLLA